MTKPKVFIYPGDSYHASIDMFTSRGFEVVKDFEGVDLICFLGGTDVDPSVYGEDRGPFTQSPDTARDAIEINAYNVWKERGIPQVGICRGGQLLNVLNGGRMIQHLGTYVSGDVLVEICGDSLVRLRADHHQGIRARDQRYTWAYLDDDDYNYAGGSDNEDTMYPDYVVYYEDTKSLCFQPHPEWGHRGTEDYFFELLERHLGLKGISDV